MQKCLQKNLGKFQKSDNQVIQQNLKQQSKKKLHPFIQNKEKEKRNENLNAARDKIIETFLDEDSESGIINSLIKEEEKNIVRSSIISSKKRIDGRDLTTVRDIDVRIDILENVHGSSYFTRGETQALVTSTLGTSSDEQIKDTLDGDKKEKFMLHYNFPPFSVNEVGRMGSTGRREIGHGKLAWRAINPILNKMDEFPYTVRVVSEITESNGSSSMATVCGTSLALMDAGVPIRKSVAGVAMGLIKEDNNFVVLTDILGDEDHLGDMDFKVAGTSDGVTALQMDIKVTGITEEIMKVALDQAMDARKHILKQMDKIIDKPRIEPKDNAPKIQRLRLINLRLGKLLDLVEK